MEESWKTLEKPSEQLDVLLNPPLDFSKLFIFTEMCVELVMCVGNM